LQNTEDRKLSGVQIFYRLEAFSWNDL